MLRPCGGQVGGFDGESRGDQLPSLLQALRRARAVHDGAAVAIQEPARCHKPVGDDQLPGPLPGEDLEPGADKRDDRRRLAAGRCRPGLRLIPARQTEADHRRRLPNALAVSTLVDVDGFVHEVALFVGSVNSIQVMSRMRSSAAH